MRYILLLIGFVLTVTAYAVDLRPDSPARYVVQPGDSLWSISSRYLAKPWEWPALWRANPQLKNPDHLYPGAVLLLRYHQGAPYIKVLSNGTIKLSPHARPSPLGEPVPPIPLSDLRPFFSASLVLDHDSLSNAPFVMAFTTEHLLGGQGDEVYVRNLCPKFILPSGVTMTYAIYRPGGPYIDPETRACLGYKATLIGYAELIRDGDPATVVLTDITQGVKLDDKVMPNNDPGFEFNFEPRSPMVPIQGHIIDLADDFTQGAVGLVVVLNRGKDAGLQPGDVLGVFKKGKCIPTCCAHFPRERLGEVMVFRTFTHTSFALVVRSIRSITLLDEVANP